jgi:predicted  nucleic acid-binding Zn-ribbon protein
MNLDDLPTNNKRRCSGCGAKVNAKFWRFHAVDGKLKKCRNCATIDAVTFQHREGERL